MKLLKYGLVVAFVLSGAGYYWFQGLEGRSSLITSDHMAPTLRTGDLIEMDKHAFEKQPPQKGDIVTFLYEGEIMMSRIVGTPGDTIGYREKQLYINGQPTQTESIGESRIENTDAKVLKETLGGKTFSIAVVPDDEESSAADIVQLREDEYYLISDFRDNSFDSRRMGPIKKSNIKGRATKILDAKDPSRVGLSL